MANRDLMEAEEFMSLIQSFLEGRLSAVEFAEEYVQTFISKSKKPNPASQNTIREYHSHKITFEEFMQRFEEENPGMIDDALFRILEDLYEDVDAFAPEIPAEEQTPYMISGQTLRQEAEDALSELREYVLKHMGD